MTVQKVAIIGANGFIGSNLTRKLAENDQVELMLFGRGEKSVSGDNIPYRQINLNDSEQLAGYFSGIDVVYFLASETIPATSWNNPKLEITNNLLPFVNFLEVATNVGVKKVIFVSSAGTIYGPTQVAANEDAIKNPFSPYGITKLTMEYYLNYFKIRSGLQYDIYRVSNVYGEGQNIAKGLGIINTFLEKIVTDKKVVVFGDGNNVRNYIYITDLVTLMASSLKSIHVSRILNASSNDTLSINELIHIMREIIPEPFEVEYTPNRQSDNAAIVLDNSRILKLNPLFTFTTIEDGILLTYQKIKERLSALH